MRLLRRLLAIIVVALLATASAQTFGCPFCKAPTPTLAEQVAQADGVCLVQFVQGEPARDQDPGSSTFEVLEVLKTPKDAVKKGEHIKRAQACAAKAGDLFLVMGTRAGNGNKIEWGTPTEITEPGFAYVAQAPPPEVSRSKRLKYFIRFLEFPDLLVANDAYFEFSNAPYKDIAAVAPLLPKEKIRGWLSQPETPQTRVGLYGLLLGLCGDKDDAKLLADKISPYSDDLRLGLDGMIAGYLLLTGNSGLDKVDDWKLSVHDGKKAAVTDTYSAIMALRFMQDYAGGKISSERLMQSMRLLLNQPELSDMAIRDLARWKDWSIQDRLMSLYGKGVYNTRAIKVAIISYMLASANDKSDGAGRSINNSSSATNLAPAARGKKYLEELRKRDPRIVHEAERFSSN
jgi:hypothetical protein